MAFSPAYAVSKRGIPLRLLFYRRQNAGSLPVGDFHRRSLPQPRHATRIECASCENLIDYRCRAAAAIAARLKLPAAAAMRYCWRCMLNTSDAYFTGDCGHGFDMPPLLARILVSALRASGQSIIN